MGIFKIIKKGTNNFWHTFNNNSKTVNLSEFEVVLDSISQTFSIAMRNGANVPNNVVKIVDIIVVDETDGNIEETFANVEALRLRLIELGYTPYMVYDGLIISLISTDADNSIVLGTDGKLWSGGGGSAVGTLQQVTDNGNETTNPIDILNYIRASNWRSRSDDWTFQDFAGNIVFEFSSIGDFSASFSKGLLTAGRNYEFPDAAGTIALISDIPSPTAILTTTITDGDTTHAPDGNSVFDALANKVDKNTAITGATKTKITYDSKGLVTNGSDATTADIADSTNKRYVTDANLTVIGNTSGTNTGDNATNSQYSGLEASKENTANKQNSLTVDGTGVKFPTVDAVNAGLANVNTNAIDRITVKLSQAINKGQAVYISSANGTNIIVSKASNTSEATSSKTLGLLETTGTTNAIVNVITDGLLAGIDTSTATIGDAVWLGTSGNLLFGLANKPVAPAHLVYIGVVSRVSATVGEIIIKVQNGFELTEIHDILITSVANNQGLFYDSATSLWKNKTIDTVLGGTPVTGAGLSGQIAYFASNGSAISGRAVAEATTGAVISFSAPQIYNSVASPATGNLTDSLSGATTGIVQKVYHQSGSTPTVPAGWKKLGSGTYSTTLLNVIYCEWVSGSRVEYWIVQSEA